MWRKVSSVHRMPMVENDEYSYIIRVLKEVMIKSTSVVYAAID